MQKATSITSDPIKPFHGSLEQTSFKHENDVLVTQSQIGNPCMFHYRREGWCPICGRMVIFASNHSWLRDHYLCSGCGSIPRERAIMYAIQTYYPNWREMRIHEICPSSRGSSAKLAKECKNFVGTQLDPQFPFGQIQPTTGLRNEDLENQTFEDSEFDLVVTQDLMQNVIGADAAFREIHRTLKSGGAHIFTVPLQNKGAPSQRRAERGTGGTIIHHFPAEYQASPFSASGSLVAYYWGFDIKDIVSKFCGCKTELLSGHNTEMGIEGEFLEVLVQHKG